MQNIKLTIAYEGTRYAGWQTQTSRESIVDSRLKRTKKQNIKTIQEEIEKALQKIFQRKITLIGSGRTDAGVHAVGQVANFKIEKRIDTHKTKKALNGLLPEDIMITHVQDVPVGFHARFCAKSKIYRYIIFNTDDKVACLHPFGVCIRHPLNVALMKGESRCLLGRHNFNSFQAADKIKRNSITTIKKILVKRCIGRNVFPLLSGVPMVIIEIEAEGFLYNMARNIAGTLIEVGRGRIKKGELENILRRRNRKSAGPCAPARGLYLMDVFYPAFAKDHMHARGGGFHD